MKIGQWICRAGSPLAKLAGMGNCAASGLYISRVTGKLTFFDMSRSELAEFEEATPTELELMMWREALSEVGLALLETADGDPKKEESNG